jgi:hypothetical protein
MPDGGVSQHEPATRVLMACFPEPCGSRLGIRQLRCLFRPLCFRPSRFRPGDQVGVPALPSFVRYP